MIGIYKITNPRGKIYVGQSVDIHLRFKKYEKLNCKSQIKIYNSLNKYGFTKHKFEVIHECEISDLNNMERYYQDLFSVLGNNGLNCVLTRSSDRNGKLSKETVLKIVSANKNRVVTSVTRGKMADNMKGNQHMLGKNHSFSTRKNMSKRMQGNTNLLGYKISEENKRKLKEVNTKIILDFSTGIFYFGVREASEAYGISKSSLCNRLIGRTKNKTNLLYI